MSDNLEKQELVIIQDVLIDIKSILSTKKQTISVAESITAGNLQSLFSSISGASSFFAGGITTYALKSKVKVLNVDEELGKKTDCVAQEIADQMAAGALDLFNSDYCVATCGYAEKDVNNNVNEPYAFISIIKNSPTGKPDYIYKDKISISGDRVHVQKEVAHTAIKELHKFLVNEYKNW